MLATAMNAPPLWEPQKRAISAVHEAVIDGCRRMCLTLPTGGGKGRVACELIRDWIVADLKVSIYTNRKSLIEQLDQVLGDFGIDHGVRADGWDDNRDQPVQISSIQTDSSRVMRKKVWQLHDADRIIVDELHLNCGADTQKIIAKHLEKPGAAFIGMTATPLGVGEMCDKLIVAGVNSELRKCGALVPCAHYGPDEPDCSKVRKQVYEYTENDIKQLMNVQHIFGRCREWYDRLNPQRKPTILFAPGVEESIWFAEKFSQAGIPAAHIDGENCWWNGKLYSSDRTARKEIIAALKAGDIKIVCNRFVLREGIDIPEIECMILATIFGQLSSFLQSVGRGLRACPSRGKTQLTLIDHGGNWWKSGSVNADREWSLDLTESIVQSSRVEKLRNKSESEPMRCPKCAKIMMSVRCSCGFQITRRTRPVVMENGELREHTGEIFKAKQTRAEPDTEKKWNICYWQAKNSGQTFRQAIGNFVRQHGYWPSTDLPLMPLESLTFWKRVCDTPVNQLRSK